MDLAFVRRFGRQLIVPGIGLAGQQRLAASRVLVVGLGGLGSSAAMALGAVGVGELHLLDPDRVDESNLHRQLLYDRGDLGRPKAEVAAARLRERNPGLRVLAEAIELDRPNALDRVRRVEVVVDASDNFPTRYLVNDACVRAGRADVFAAVHRLEGQFAVFDAGRGPCYRCLFPTPPGPESAPPCGEAGVLGTLPTLLGAMQATAAVGVLLGWRTEPAGRLVLVDAESMEFRELRVARRAGCDGCSESARAGAMPPSAAGPPGATAEGGFAYIDARALRAELAGPVPPTIVDVRSEAERFLPGIPGSRSIPLESLVERMDELADAVRPVVVCQWGGQAERAGRLLGASGLRQVRALQGGLEAFLTEGGASASRADLPA